MTPTTIMSGPRRHLRPLARGPWLRRRVWTAFTWCGVGVLGLGAPLLLGWLATLPLEKRPAAGFVFICYLVVGWLAEVIGLPVWALTLRQRQYCPECLRWMVRGARICPWCHFRPAPSGATSPTGQD